MVKSLIDPTSGDSVRYERAYIDDEVEKGRREAVRAFRHELGGARNLLPSKRKQGVLIGGGTMYGYDRATGGSDRRKAFREHLSSPGGTKQWERAWEGGPREGIAFDRGVDRTVARHNAERRHKEEAKLRKRYDETALQHHGSRRVGGRTPVSTTRVPGLPVSSASFSRGNPEARPGTRSHALQLTHVHTRVKASRGGALFRLGRRSATPQSMRKGLVAKELPMRLGARRALGMVSQQRGAARINDAMRLKESPRVAAARASKGTSGFGQSGAAGRRITSV